MTREQKDNQEQLVHRALAELQDLIVHRTRMHSAKSTTVMVPHTLTLSPRVTLRAPTR
jgi:hypothetical protein